MNRNSVGRSDENLVNESAKVCIDQLSELSMKLQKNKEELSKEDIESFRLEIVNLLKSVISSKYTNVKTSEAIESILGQRQAGSDGEVAKRAIKQKIEEATNIYDATKDAEFIRISSILKGADADIDEDFVMIDQGLKENDTKCPFSFQVFNEPMKNVGGPGHPKCIHHVSRESLESMCKKSSSAKCPIGGCAGRWSKATAVHDPEFERKVQKFLTNKNVEQLAGGAQSSNAQDTYTQV